MFQSYVVEDLPADRRWRGLCNGKTWEPRLDVTIIHAGYESRRMRAIVDSGSQVTIFEVSIGEALGIRMKDCPSYRLLGASGDGGLVYFSDVQMKFQQHSVWLRAGFCYGFPVPALLGRYGFFDHFKVTFHPHLGGMHIERVPQIGAPFDADLRNG